MKREWILGAIIFQLVCLLGMLANAYAPLYFGKEIKVKVSLYDPRDFLRGNYVKLSYDFSDVGDNYRESGRKIYAILKKNKEGFYIFDKYSYNEPENGVFIAGRVNYFSANYGVEAFFLPKDKALKMENDIREKEAYAIIAVMDNGKARVKEIVITNKARINNE